MAKIVWTPEAEQWLRDIHEYIAQDSPDAAMRTVESLYKKVQLLSRFPELGYRYEHSTERDIRILLYGHYRIAYTIRPDGNIGILGVFHAALDIERYLS